MEKTPSKFISLSYKLYTVEDGTQALVEQTQADRPFEFISGFSMALDAFEAQVSGLAAGEKFDFTIAPEAAFGSYDEAGVHKLSRDVFSINGHFDHENIYPGAVITLMDEDEKRFMARIVEVGDDGVTVDTNHPLAGETLRFVGEMIENREATKEELEKMIHSMGCGGCDCDDCGGDHHHCGDHHHHGDGHHHHGDGCGCGHCH